MAVALNDIELSDSTVERSKSTPARAVNSVLQGLEAETVAHAEKVPNNGPMIWTITGTNQVLGFDPADLPHYYITGETGSGKSYLKRIFLENIASLGYDILSISPSDTEETGLSLPNPEHSEGSGLTVDQYWIATTVFLTSRITSQNYSQGSMQLHSKDYLRMLNKSSSTTYSPRWQR